MNHLINYILLYKYYIINKYFIHLKKYRVVFKVNTSFLDIWMENLRKKDIIYSFYIIQVKIKTIVLFNIIQNFIHYILV